jgi:hypothetical protein
MDVKDSQRIVDDVASTPLNFARAKGFLDFRDQLKETGVKEALERVWETGGGCNPTIARDALAKLNALLGEKPTETPKQKADREMWADVAECNGGAFGELEP